MTSLYTHILKFKRRYGNILLDTTNYMNSIENQEKLNNTVKSYSSDMSKFMSDMYDFEVIVWKLVIFTENGLQPTDLLKLSRHPTLALQENCILHQRE